MLQSQPQPDTRPVHTHPHTRRSSVGGSAVLIENKFKGQLNVANREGAT